MGQTVDNFAPLARDNDDEKGEPSRERSSGSPPKAPPASNSTNGITRQRSKTETNNSDKTFKCTVGEGCVYEGPKVPHKKSKDGQKGEACKNTGLKSGKWEIVVNRRRRLASRHRLESRPIHRLLREINRAQGQA